MEKRWNESRKPPIVDTRWVAEEDFTRPYVQLTDQMCSSAIGVSLTKREAIRLGFHTNEFSNDESCKAHRQWARGVATISAGVPVRQHRSDRSSTLRDGRAPHVVLTL